MRWPTVAEVHHWQAHQPEAARTVAVVQKVPVLAPVVRTVVPVPVARTGAAVAVPLAVEVVRTEAVPVVLVHRSRPTGEQHRSAVGERNRLAVVPVAVAVEVVRNQPVAVEVVVQTTVHWTRL